jgi:hypothetical protein
MMQRKLPNSMCRYNIHTQKLIWAIKMGHRSQLEEFPIAKAGII